jgi:hypothetical protein
VEVLGHLSVAADDSDTSHALDATGLPAPELARTGGRASAQ